MADLHQELAPRREWSVVSVATLDAICTAPPFPYDTFVLLLAADGRDFSDHALREHATWLLRAGARCVCTWGPDCERIHDAFDQAALELGLNREGAVIMTSWHDREPLKEATWFAAVTAFPDEAYPDADGALVAISVGSKEWEAEIHEYLKAGTPIDDEA
jgi:hypothetical protein